MPNLVVRDRGLPAPDPDEFRLDVPPLLRSGRGIAHDIFTLVRDFSGRRDLPVPVPTFSNAEYFTLGYAAGGVGGLSLRGEGFNVNLPSDLDSTVPHAELRDAILQTHKDLRQYCRELGVNFFNCEATPDDVRRFIGQGKLGLAPLSERVIRARVDRVFESPAPSLAVQRSRLEDALLPCFPLVGFGPDRILVHLYDNPFLAVDDPTFVEAREAARVDRATVFFSRPRDEPIKMMKAPGLPALFHEGREVSFFEIDWHYVFSDEMMHSYGRDIPQRFDEYFDTGRVDFDFERRAKDIHQPDYFLASDGKPDFKKLLPAITDLSCTRFEAMLLAVPRPRDLPEAELTALRHAVLERMSISFEHGRIVDLFETIEKIGGHFLDTFDVMEESFPKLIQPKYLPHVGFYSSIRDGRSGVVRESSNIEEIRTRLTEEFNRTDADEICAQIENAPGLLFFFRTLNNLAERGGIVLKKRGEEGRRLSAKPQPDDAPRLPGNFRPELPPPEE